MLWHKLQFSPEDKEKLRKQVYTFIQALGKCTSKVKLMFCFTAIAQLYA